MQLLEHRLADPEILEDRGDPYLRGWYPGFGEMWIFERLPRTLQEYLAQASQEYPPFVEGYLVPTLGEPDPCERILSDLNCALAAADLESEGLGDYEELLDESAGLGDLGNLGKSFLKKVAKTIRSVHKKIAKAIVPKPIRKFEEKAHKAITKVERKVEKAGSKILTKYGNVLITAAGAILAPFTGGASLAAAALLTGANTAYQKKRAADRAKKLAKADAAKLTQEAAQAQAQVDAQVDHFYNDNQAWFEQRGITPATWAGMTSQQKIDAINAGATGGSGGAAPGSWGAPSGGGGGGSAFPGGGWGSDGAGPSGAPGSGPKASQAGLLDGDGGMLLPALALAAFAVMSGRSGGKGGRRRSRARRNPSRRPRRRRW